MVPSGSGVAPPRLKRRSCTRPGCDRESGPGRIHCALAAPAQASIRGSATGGGRKRCGHRAFDPTRSWHRTRRADSPHVSTRESRHRTALGAKHASSLISSRDPGKAPPALEVGRLGAPISPVDPEHRGRCRAAHNPPGYRTREDLPTTVRRATQPDLKARRLSR